MDDDDNRQQTPSDSNNSHDLLGWVS